MQEKRTALLVTYYWPPASGAGVHRWLRFSAFFKENNWDLHVYCPQDAAWPSLDENLIKQVSADLKIVRRKIFEPHKYLGKKNNPNAAAGITRKEKSSFIQNLIIWIRGNLFIPDARVFWIKPSVRFLNKYLNEHPEIDTIITTGPPHSMHLIGRGIKKKRKINWVADFRDPWTEIDFYKDLLPGKWADQRHKNFEKSVLSEADHVITVSKSCAEGLERIGGRKVEVITNGFVFPEFDPRSQELDKRFTICHFGSMPGSRNPEVLWKSLSKLLDEDESLKSHLEIRLIGSVDYLIHDSIHKYQLADYFNHIETVSHSESLLMQRQSQILLLVANNTGNVKGILTGKVLEYLGSKRPILAIGQQGSDLQEVIESTNGGCFVDYFDELSCVDFLRESFKKYQEKSLFQETKNLDQFSSSTLVKKLLSIIGEPK